MTFAPTSSYDASPAQSTALIIGQGTNKHTGERLSGWEHCAQCIENILTTPIGSRIMLRDYGSNLHELLDNPMNDELVLNIIVAVHDALVKWEPRFEISEVFVTPAGDGSCELVIRGTYLPENLTKTTEVRV